MSDKMGNKKKREGSSRCHIRRKSLRRRRNVEVFSGIRQSPELLREVQWLWKNAGGDRILAKSFWIGKDDQPRCCLEAFAQKCAAFHYPDYLGAEYWVQIRRGSQGDAGGLEFHFDKDEHLMKTQDVWFHPHFSTVTYFDPSSESNQSNESNPTPFWGAPLVVFKTTSYENCATSFLEPCRVSPSRGWVLFPRPGNHIKFSGNFLHGVPSELNSHLYGVPCSNEKNNQNSNNAIFERTSVPVNIWSHHKPFGVERIPQDYLHDMEKSFNPSLFFPLALLDSYFNSENLMLEDLCMTRQPCLCAEDVDNTTGSLDLFFLDEHVDGSTAPLPLSLIKSELNKYINHHQFHVDRRGSGPHSRNCAGLKIFYM